MPCGCAELLSLVPVVLVALATAGVAAAGNGGFAPVAPASPNATHIQHAYYLILGFTAAIFLLVESLLVIFIVKYRSRGRSRAVEGAQVHGHTRLELMWTAGPVVILAIIAGFVFYELPEHHARSGRRQPDPRHGRGPSVLLAVRLHRHPGSRALDRDAARAGRRGRRSQGRVAGRHPQLVDPGAGRQDPGDPGPDNHTWFKAQPGSYDGQCAELCGAFHASMARPSRRGPSRRTSTTSRRGTRRSASRSGTASARRATGTSARAATARDRQQLAARSSGKPRRDRPQRLHRHAGLDAPVGDTWTRAELDALAAYVKKHIYKAAPAGGTSGG